MYIRFTGGVLFSIVGVGGGIVLTIAVILSSYGRRPAWSMKFFEIFIGIAAACIIVMAVVTTIVIRMSIWFLIFYGRVRRRSTYQ